jgi:hypothetical protein
MTGSTLILLLAIVTLGAGLLFGLWQVVRTKNSQVRNGDSNGDIATAQAVDAPADQKR